MSIVEIILACSAGFLKALQLTMCPRRTREVSAASAASDVNDSNVSSSVGSGVVWKWSNSQIDSNPSASAACATSTVRCHAASGSIPAYSPVQPWGTMIPTFTMHLFLCRHRRNAAPRWKRTPPQGLLHVACKVSWSCAREAPASCGSVRAVSSRDALLDPADLPGTMRGVVLPGGRTVEWRDVPIPRPGPRQVLVRVRASSICGSDIRAIYREHLGRGAEAYQDVIAGHEPAGEAVALGEGCRRVRVGDRVAIYHIAGCGMCDECRRGYMIGCHGESRAAYGWQRDGGHAPYLLAEEVTCIPLPDELSFVDGASAACSGGTAYEAVLRIGVSGRDALLVTGLGPVGLAVALVARGLGVRRVLASDPSPERRQLAASLGLVDASWDGSEGTLDAVLEASGGGVEASVDASGAAAGRRLAVAALRDWGRCAWVGEGGTVELPVSPLVIHKQVAIHGSWVTSLEHMAELLDRLVRWDLRLESLVTDRLPLDAAGEAYAIADRGAAGKVCLVLD